MIIFICLPFQNGIIIADDVTYFVKPLQRVIQKNESITSHVIIKLDSNINTNEKKNKKRGMRRKRYTSSKRELNIETAVFVDRDLYRYMVSMFPNNTERDIFRFVLAIINAVRILSL